MITAFTMSYDASVKCKKQDVKGLIHHNAREVDMQNGISAMEYDQKRKNFFGVPGAECDNPYSESKRQNSTVDSLEEFKKLFE